MANVGLKFVKDGKSFPIFIRTWEIDPRVLHLIALIRMEIILPKIADGFLGKFNVTTEENNLII
jgi:hypothetical protein